MAKKAKSEYVPPIPCDDPEVKTMLEITRDDVVSVAVSREEEKMQIRKAEADAQIAELAEQIKTLEARMNKEHRESAERAGSALKRKTEKLMTELGVRATVTVDFGAMGEKSQSLAYTLGVKSNDGYPYGRDSLSSKTFSVAMTAGQKVDLKKLQELRKQRDALENESVQMRKALANLPIYERKVKARLAEAAMQSTQRGRAMLKTLDSVKGIKALGVG